jgi:hypothetical protein
MGTLMMMFSWTKIGTIVSILAIVLSLPEVGAIIPPALSGYFVIALNAIMFLKRTFWPKVTIAPVP